MDRIDFLADINNLNSSKDVVQTLNVFGVNLGLDSRKGCDQDAVGGHDSMASIFCEPRLVRFEYWGSLLVHRLLNLGVILLLSLTYGGQHAKSFCRLVLRRHFLLSLLGLGLGRKVCWFFRSKICSPSRDCLEPWL